MLLRRQTHRLKAIHGGTLKQVSPRGSHGRSAAKNVTLKEQLIPEHVKYSRNENL